MKHELYKSRHALYQHHSAQFLRSTPRTFRDAFGHSWKQEDNSYAILVGAFIAAAIVFIVGVWL